MVRDYANVWLAEVSNSKIHVLYKFLFRFFCGISSFFLLVYHKCFIFYFQDNLL